MEHADPRAAPGSVRLLDFRSGGWVLASSATLAVLLLAWALLGVRGPRKPGDGRTVDSYGFSLEPCLVPRGQLTAAGFPRDALPVLTDPRILTLAESEALAAELRTAHAGKLLVSNDRVIGVEIDGQARAYPLRFMTWHEVVNDVLGGHPIVVTYNPLCDSTLVFDREVDGAVREFGISGLVHNSNTLLYDRAAADGIESLWSQLECRAIAGPAAARGARLTLAPAVLVHWDDWRRRYPDTTLLAPDRARLKLYKRSYEMYFASERLYFPVAPLPPPGSWPLKTPVVALRADAAAAWRVLPIAEIAARAGERGTCFETIDGVDVRIAYRGDPPAIWPEFVDPGRGRPQCIHALWFAWYAAHEGGGASGTRPGRAAAAAPDGP